MHEPHSILRNTASIEEITTMSALGSAYERIYSALCGRHPNVRLWHFQWLAGKDLYRDLKLVLPSIQGRVLDVGCGHKPYEGWLSKTASVVGIDVSPGPRVDVQIVPGQPWPLGDAEFDGVLCTQVVEHARDFEHVLAEIYRNLKPGGYLVLTVPFAYNVHDAHDYRRFSVQGIRELFAERYEIIELKGQGGVGSTIGLLLLNWIEITLNLSKIGRWLKGLALPLWILFSAFVNFWGWILDSLDHSRAFYSNVVLVARKRCA